MSTGTRAVAGSLTLFVASLGALALGHFIRFDDFSGFGSDRWILPWGLLAGVLALASLVVAWRDLQGRRWLGAVLILLGVLLAWQRATNDGFRFVWARDEGELFLLQVVLGLTALTLLATSSGRRGDWPTRAVGYLAATAVAVGVAFHLGVVHFERSHCVGNDGECDLAALEGLAFAAATLVLAAVSIVIVEVRRARRSRHLTA